MPYQIQVRMVKVTKKGRKIEPIRGQAALIGKQKTSEGIAKDMDALVRFASRFDFIDTIDLTNV